MRLGATLFFALRVSRLSCATHIKGWRFNGVRATSENDNSVGISHPVSEVDRIVSETTTFLQIAKMTKR